jgi:hypothetical protein
MVFLPKPEMVRRKLTGAPAVPGDETDFQNSHPYLFAVPGNFNGNIHRAAVATGACGAR